MTPLDPRESSRNEVAPETAEQNRDAGGYTFNAFPPDGYIGPIMVFAAVRLGDHAHVEVQSGRWFSAGPDRGQPNCGIAGGMVLRWHEWLAFRDELDAYTVHRIAEVERPTRAQLDRYTAASARGQAA